MTQSLISRKRQFIRNSIYEVAIDLFEKNGFEETTVDEIAEAAEISKRSFFRYFESKDDLLAMSIVTNGEQIREAVASCPAKLSLHEVVRQAVFAGVSFTKYQPRTRSIIEIALKSTAARQAHYSRLMEEQGKLAATLATRMKSSSQYHLAPYFTAGLIWTVIISSTAAWSRGQCDDIHAAADKAFTLLAQLQDESSATTASALGVHATSQHSAKPQSRKTRRT